MRRWLSLCLVLLVTPVWAQENTVLGLWCHTDGTGGWLDINEDEIGYGESTFCDLPASVLATRLYQATITCANYLNTEHRTMGGGAFRNTFEITAQLVDNGLLYVSYVGNDVLYGTPLQPETYELCNE